MARIVGGDSMGGGVGAAGGRTAAKVTAAQAGPGNVARISSTVKVIRHPMTTENNPKIIKQISGAKAESLRIRNGAGITGKSAASVNKLFK